MSPGPSSARRTESSSRVTAASAWILSRTLWAGRVGLLRKRGLHDALLLRLMGDRIALARAGSFGATHIGKRQLLRQARLEPALDVPVGAHVHRLFLDPGQLTDIRIFRDQG